MATLYSSGASTPDATESTAGKLRISTALEATTGTNDTTAMTPAKVAAAISAGSGGITGALVYRGSYDASTASPDLTTASKGDFYLVSVAGALDGVALSVGDHVVFNQDAANPVTAAMFDKIDSTDAVSSVNGQTGVITLTASDVNALASGDNVSELTNDSGYITSAPVTSVNTQTGVVNLTAANVGALASGDNVSSLTNDSGYLTSTLSADIIVDTDGAYDLGTESARLGLTFSDLDGAVTFKASNASGAQITKGQPVYIAGVSGDVPTVALADADAAAMPCAGLAAETANSGAAIRIVSFGNLTGVDTSAFSLGDTLYIDTTAGQLVATPPAGETAKLQNIGRVIRVHATSGIIKVGGAGRSAATPNLDQNKIFLGDANNRSTSTALSTVALSSFNNDLGLATVATSGAYSDLSGTPDLSIYAPLASPALTGTPTADTATAGTNTTQLATTAFVTTAVAAGGGGGISNIVEDTTPQLGGDLDPNGFGVSGDLSPSAANTHALGSADAEWSDLYLGDGAVINFGLDQDIKLTHEHNSGLVLEKNPGSAFYPRLTLRNQDSGSLSYAELKFDAQSTSPATNDFIGRVLASGKNSVGGNFDYSKIETRIADATDSTEAGRLLLRVGTGGTVAGNSGTDALDIHGTSGGDIVVKIPEHDGASSGLMLGSTLLTSTAAELNLLDGGASVGSSITISDTDGFVVNDGGVSKLIPASDLKTYAASGGGGGVEYSAISSATTAQISYHYSCTGTFTLTIPTSQAAGSEIRIKNMGTGTITLDPQTSNIDGSSTDYTMDVQFGALTLVSDGTGWEII